MDRDFEEFKHLFPPETKIINFSGCADNYVANLRSKCKNKADFGQNWLKQYEQLSGVTLRLHLTRPRCGKTAVYKAVYRCDPDNHQSADPVVIGSYKHTDCQAIMRVTIKSTENQRVRSNGVLCGGYPTLITIEHNHNHRIEPANALELKSVSQAEITNNDSSAKILRPKNEEVREDCLYSYEVEKTNDSPAKRLRPKNEEVREDCLHSYEVEKTNDSPAKILRPKNEEAREDCLHSYEVEKTNDSPAKRLRPKNEEVREDCLHSYEVEKTNDSPAKRLRPKNEEVREECVQYHEEPVASTVYPSLYILSNTDALREIELTAHHVEVTTEPFVKIEKEHTELNWSSLKDRWKLLFEQWQQENSFAQYDALVRAVTILNNCKTETAAIECLGKHFNTNQNRTTVTRRCVESDSIAKFSLSDHNYNKERDPQNEQLSYTVEDWNSKIIS